MEMSTTSPLAVRYIVERDELNDCWDVVMITSDDRCVVSSRASQVAAQATADRFQKRENKRGTAA